MKQSIIFYLVRHGEAENNVRSVLNSFPAKKEYSLTDKGREQAKKAAAFLATVGADVILSSPLLRAKQTAEIIAEATHLSIAFDERLYEVGMGVFNGKSHETLLKKYPKSEMRLAPDMADRMESFLQVRGRLEIFLDEMRECFSGKKVILVSHADTLEQLHGILTKEGPGRAAEGWWPEKGSCTEVVYEFEKK